MAFPLNRNEHDEIESRIIGQEELIVGAAIRCKGMIVTGERPKRHGDCINFLNAVGLDYADQGFITNHGRFVDRKEAAKIVEESGQGSIRDNCGGNLFSEDMWGEFGSVDAKDIF